MKFDNTAEKDRYYICKIGQLFWGNDKQCYAPDAVYRKVKESSPRLPNPIHKRNHDKKATRGMSETRKYVFCDFLMLAAMVFFVFADFGGFALMAGSTATWFSYKAGWNNHKEWVSIGRG